MSVGRRSCLAAKVKQTLDSHSTILAVDIVDAELGVDRERLCSRPALADVSAAVG